MTCGTPGCVAAQIVAHDPELQEQLAEAIYRIDKREPHCGRADAITVAVERVATRALDTGRTPRLFSRTWPAAWLQASSEDPAEDPGGTFMPKADDAVEVLDGILDGRIHGPLESERR